MTDEALAWLVVGCFSLAGLVVCFGIGMWVVDYRRRQAAELARRLTRYRALGGETRRRILTKCRQRAAFDFSRN
jgi:hypothetical protein